MNRMGSNSILIVFKFPSNPKQPRKGHPVTASADTFASPTLAENLSDRSASWMSATSPGIGAIWVLPIGDELGDVGDVQWILLNGGLTKDL